MKDEQVKVIVKGWTRWDDGTVSVDFVTWDDHTKVLMLLDSMSHPDSIPELILSKPTGTTPNSQPHL